MSVTRTLEFPDARCFLQRMTGVPRVLQGYEDVTVMEERGNEMYGLYPGCLEISRRLCCVVDQTTPVHKLSCVSLLLVSSFFLTLFAFRFSLLLCCPHFSTRSTLLLSFLSLYLSFLLVFLSFLLWKHIHRARWIELEQF